MLEKGINKKVRSFIYTTSEEAEYYRSFVGGHIITLQTIEQKTEYIECLGENWFWWWNINY